MKLVVDTNRIIAALVRDGASRRILFSDLRRLTVEMSQEELRPHWHELLVKSCLSDHELCRLLETFGRRMIVIPDTSLEPCMGEAREIMDRIDPSDTPFIAAALCVECDGIWTDDAHFLRQGKVKVWRTADIIRYLAAARRQKP